MGTITLEITKNNNNNNSACMFTVNSLTQTLEQLQTADKGLQ